MSWGLPALALSCLPYGVTDAYRLAAKSEARYVIVRGTLRFDTALLPRPDPTGQSPTPPETEIPAEIEGVAIGPNGRREAARYKIRLVVRCSGPWCAQPSGGDALAFLRREGLRRYVLEDDPCGAYLFSRPSASDMQAVQRCISLKPCPASTLRP